MIQVLTALATHALALAVYPGLVTAAVFGVLAELTWTRVVSGAWTMPERPRRRLTPVISTVALCSILAAVQLAAPLNLVPREERSVVIAAVALTFTVWAELALTVDFVAEPGLLLLLQCCWLLAVLGPAVQPESLRPQVLGNMLVPALLPAKVASGLLYLACMPALLRLWPLAPAGNRRVRARLDIARALCWFPYCGLFTTLFLPPSGDDLGGLVRFFVITLAVAALVIGAGMLMHRRGTSIARRVYVRAVPPYAALVLAIVLATSIALR